MLVFPIEEMTAMQPTLRSRARILVGLAAAAGAFGAAAMLSAATAPTARADDFSDIISAVDGDYAAGQAAYTDAFTDFGSNNVTAGLVELFDGVDDDVLSAPNNLLVGSLEALTNESVTGDEPFGLFQPGSFSEALTTAESLINTGESYFTTAATDFTAGDYGEAALLDLFGADYVSIVPLEDLILGAAVSF
jgi:hypothetical protein